MASTKDNLSIVMRESEHILSVLDRKIDFGELIDSKTTESHEDVLKIKENLQAAAKKVVDLEQESVEKGYLELIKNNGIRLDDLKELIDKKGSND